MRPWGYPDKTNDSDPQRSGNTIETPATIATPYGQDEMPTVLFRGRAVRKREHPFVLNGC